MAEEEFDEKKFFDRSVETELFTQLLAFKDNRRILVIADNRGGAGKSQLLKKFEHSCLTSKPRVRVALVKLDELKPQDPLNLVETLAKSLTQRFNLDFSTFYGHWHAKRLGDLAFFLSSTVYLQGANLSGASSFKVSGQMFNERVQTVNVSNAAQRLDPEQEELAGEICIKAFFEDLKKHSSDTPLVILLDTFEKERCPDVLRKWIVNYLMERCFFDTENSPKHLLLAIAGRLRPPFESNWASEDITAIVASREKLGNLEEHIVEILEANKYLYEAADVKLYVDMAKLGLPPLVIDIAMRSKHEILRAN